MVLYVHAWGSDDAPPVVCLHGLSGHGGRFRDLAERLPGRHLVAPDLRGHGSSGWDPPWDVETHVADLLETVEALGLGSAAWIGHSFGGRLVAELAARAPARADRAVLLDPALWIAPSVCAERAEATRADSSFASVDEAIDTRLADGTLFSTPRETLEAEAAAHLERGDDGRLRWRFSPPAAITAWSEMSAPAPPFPSCPTLVVLGERSWIPVDVPAAPHVETLTVPGGHSVLWDAFEETAAAVARFLC